MSFYNHSGEWRGYAREGTEKPWGEHKASSKGRKKRNVLLTVMQGARNQMIKGVAVKGSTLNRRESYQNVFRRGRLIIGVDAR